MCAQVPQKMSFQGVIRNSSNELLTNQIIGMRIQILQGSEFGASVFVETHTPTTNANGLVTLEIGTGTAILGAFADINWASGPYYILTETDPSGGTNYNISSTSELLSVPYALFSASGTPGPQGPQGEPGATGPQGPAGTIPPGTNVGEMMYWNGTAWVAIAPGTNGQTLTFCNGVPTWGPCPSDNLIIVACDSYTWSNNDQTYTSSGIYTGNEINGIVQTLNLTIIVSTTNTTNVTATDTYTWSNTGETYTASGIYTGTTTNCITEILDLTIETTPVVGDPFQGGVLAYLLQPGDIGYDPNVPHGIIAAPNDLSSTTWGCGGTLISGADGTAIGTGALNTTQILNGCPSPTIAAGVCQNLVLNGYDDWYLPSRNELTILYNNREVIGGFTTSNVGFGLEYYWSSTEYNNDASFAWVRDFGSGYSGNGGKNGSYRVRPIRQF